MTGTGSHLLGEECVRRLVICLHLSFENETVRQAVCRGPQTRSKATSRQIRLTDCFSRAATGAGKEKRADVQRGLEPHSATDSAS